MSEVREMEIVESEGCEIAQIDGVVLAKTVAGNVAEMLATAPSNAGEKVEAIEVDCIPVLAYKIKVRLVLR